MGKNTKGGKHHKKGKNANYDKVKKMIYADNESTLYGLIVSSQGDCRFLVHCSDNINRTGTIRGKLYKKSFINPEDVVLVSLRDFETQKDGVLEKCDIMMRYDSQEIEQLKSIGLYYKNTTNPFCTVLENGKPSVSEVKSDGFSFTNRDVDDLLEENSNSSNSESDDEEPIQYAPPPKRSNVKVIDSTSSSEQFDFDAI